MLDSCHRATQHSTVINAVDSILRIIDTKEDSTTIVKKLKTIKPYITKLTIIEQQVYNTISSF